MKKKDAYRVLGVEPGVDDESECAHAIRRGAAAPTARRPLVQTTGAAIAASCAVSPARAVAMHLLRRLATRCALSSVSRCPTGPSLTAPDPSATALRRAYKRKALKTHPDKNRNDPDAKKKFQEVSTAYKRITEGTAEDDEDDAFEAFDGMSEVRAARLLAVFQVRSGRRLAAVPGKIVQVLEKIAQQPQSLSSRGTGPSHVEPAPGPHPLRHARSQHTHTHSPPSPPPQEEMFGMFDSMFGDMMENMFAKQMGIPPSFMGGMGGRGGGPPGDDVDEDQLAAMFAAMGGGGGGGGMGGMGGMDF